MRLAEALALSEIEVQDKTTVRTGMARSLEALIAYARDTGVDPAILTASFRLLDALDDLDDGVVDPGLVPAKARRRDPRIVWKIRAILTIALEARYATGISAAAAAAEICRAIDFSVLMQKSRSPRKPVDALLAWRRALTGPTRNRAPQTGRHWDIVASGLALIERWKTYAPEQQGAHLWAAYLLWGERAILLLASLNESPNSRANQNQA
jgi:hypothetical protein